MLEASNIRLQDRNWKKKARQCMQEINIKIIYSVVCKETFGIKHIIIVFIKSLLFLFPKLSGLLQFNFVRA